MRAEHQTDFIGTNSQSGYGMGVSNKTMAGFRHFENCEFLGEFPFAEITFSDRDFPGEVVLKAFNPLIPRDDKNSSLPAAFFEITFNNTTESDVEFEPYFSLMNPFSATVNEKTQKGVLLKSFGKTADELGYGELCLIAENPEQIVPFWFRGRANDAVTVFMNEIKNVVYDCIDDVSRRGYTDWVAMKTRVRDDLSRYLYEKTKRSPMILPIIMEI